MIILTEFFAQRTVVHVPNIAMLNDCRAEYHAAAAWLRCGPKYLQSNRRLAFSSSVAWKRISLTHLNLALRRCCCMRHHIAAGQFGLGVPMTQGEYAVRRTGEILNKFKNMVMRISDYVWSAKGRIRFEHMQTSVIRVLSFVFFSTANMKLVNLWRTGGPCRPWPLVLEPVSMPSNITMERWLRMRKQNECWTNKSHNQLKHRKWPTCVCFARYIFIRILCDAYMISAISWCFGCPITLRYTAASRSRQRCSTTTNHH